MSAKLGPAGLIIMLDGPIVAAITRSSMHGVSSWLGNRRVKAHKGFEHKVERGQLAMAKPEVQK